MTRRPHRLPHDKRILVYALLAGLPGVLASSILLLWGGDYAGNTVVSVLLLIVGCWLGFAFSAHARVVRTLQTVGNLLSALREGDFSIRGRGVSRADPLGDVMSEINTLGNTLSEQRLGALEATTLLRTVMAEIDVAIFAFDAANILRLVNPAGQQLLDTPAERLLDRAAHEIGLGEFLEGEDARVIETVRFAGADQKARWSLRRSRFRERGAPHTLVVVADVSQALREEEIKAWQRLVRVLGHELNNSLAPIKSIAGSLGSLVARPGPDRAADWEDDMRSGLNVIAARADSLTRFMEAYARLTRLPPPTLAPVDIDALIRRVASLEVRLSVRVVPGPAVSARLDAAQIEQVLINLIANAADAAFEAAPGARDGVSVSWNCEDGVIEIAITDTGHGLASASNLFVPFFTTKQKGSGIGLVLCRQIAENHGGSVTLENRADARTGCVARLRLPV